MPYVKINNSLVKMTDEEYNSYINDNTPEETDDQKKRKAISLKMKIDAGKSLNIDVSDLQTQLDAVMAELS